MIFHTKIKAFRSGTTKLYHFSKNILHDSRLQRVISRATFTMAAKVAGAGAGFSFNVLVARQLGVDDYGLFTYAITLVAMLSVLSASGLNTVTVQFVAAYAIEQRWALLSGLLRWALIRVCLISGAVTACLILVTKQPYVDIDPDERLTLLVGSGVVFFGALAVVESGILRGFKQFIIAELVDTGAGLRSLFSLAVLLVMLAFGGRLSGADQGMWISTLCALAALVCSSVVLFRSLPPSLKLQESEYNTRKWTKTAVPLMLMNAAFLFQSQVDIIMLKHMSTTVDVALFFAAWRISSLVLFPVISVGAITAPTMVELFTLKKYDDLQKLIYQTSTITFFSAIIVCIIGLWWGRNVLSLFGTEFVDGYRVLVILLAGQCISAFAGNLVLLMTVSGHYGAACRIVVLAVLGNIGLNLVLIPVMGREGAAWSSFVVSLTSSGTMAWALYRLTGLRASPGAFLFDKLNEYRRKVFGSHKT